MMLFRIFMLNAMRMKMMNDIPVREATPEENAALLEHMQELYEQAGLIDAVEPKNIGRGTSEIFL